MIRSYQQTAARKSKRFDVAIVGLGAIGSSTAYALAKEGLTVVGIDQFSPPHTNGSSHGESRIMRQAIGEGEAYVPIVLRSNAILAEIEQNTGVALVERCGFLFITRDDAGTSHHGHPHFLASTVKAAKRFGIPHELLSAEDLRREFRQFAIEHGDEKAYWEPGGGYTRPELMIAEMLRIAAARGLEIVTECAVRSLAHDGTGVRLSTSQGDILAGHVILAAGAWLSRLAPQSVTQHLKIYRQTLHWYPLLDVTDYVAGRSPTFIWTHGLESDQQFYGFPPVEGRVKVAAERYLEVVDPSASAAAIDDADAIWMSKSHVNGRLSGVGDFPVRSSHCLYTATPDLDFLIDYELAGLIQVVSACSGHGFKHAPAIGEAIAARALGRIPIVDVTAFASSRLQSEENGGTGKP